uniref:Uncharacterized protein n=1 Tax=Anguilla anguilla TaxID=7936 RepID=A0A0E9UMC4_ANGAN
MQLLHLRATQPNIRLYCFDFTFKLMHNWKQGDSTIK